MSLIKYNPVLAPTRFAGLFDRLFSDSYLESNHLKFSPEVDLIEKENSYEIHAALPGIKKEDINVEIADGMITLSGERKISNEKKDTKYHVLETQYGHFSRSFYLPDNVNADKINAEFESGILVVTVPKDNTKPAKTKIQVK
ncbi:MAG: Hsp20/alpha crystallin family protein [Cytophagales bacterium]|nr:Hsp20/alpha crystallin family protein [Cytophagales bacterium]